MATTFETYPDEELWLLRDERESLRDEIADLKAQLDDADATAARQLKAKDGEIAALRAHNDQLVLAERELQYLQRKMARLQRENDKLRAENRVAHLPISDLQERLEIAASPPLDLCPSDRYPWRFHFTPDGLAALEDTIEYQTGRPATGTDSDGDALTQFCRRWLARGRHDQRICDAAAKINHAGLAWLAVEADWLQILSQYGVPEAIDLVETLARTSDEHEVAEVIDNWFGVAVR